MKILFLYPMWTGAYKGITGYFARKSGGTYPPLNLALLAAIAEEKGHQVEIIDAEVEKLPMDELVKEASKRDADIIGMTGMSPFFHLSKDLATLLKKEGLRAKICIGGQHITIVQESAFDEMFDYAFLGDSEEGWGKFLDVVENGGSFEAVPSLMYRESGKVVKNNRVSSSRDLDIYPLAARHLLPMDKYQLGTLRGRLNFATIQMVRGCPWKCIFCASDILATSRIARRSISSIINEVKHIIDEYGIRHFMVLDDVLTLSRKRTEEFCDAILEQGLDMTFEGSTRANLIDEEQIIKMKKAGLIRLSFGLETVDEEMRKTMNKRVPLEAYSEANALLNKYDIEALNSVMIGLPGESVENVRKTLNFLKKSKDVKQANFAIAIPYPGTEFHRIAMAGENDVELLTKDFSEYRRYGKAVTRVSGLSPDDLIRLQNEGFVSVYSRYWRWWSVIRKNGILGLVFTFYRLLKMYYANVVEKPVESKRHPNLE